MGNVSQGKRRLNGLLSLRDQHDREHYRLIKVGFPMISDLQFCHLISSIQSG